MSTARALTGNLLVIIAAAITPAVSNASPRLRGPFTCDNWHVSGIYVYGDISAARHSSTAWASHRAACAWANEG